MSSQEITLTARCLCKANTFTATVPHSSLPIPAYYCHCDSCRRLTGALYSSDAEWPGAPEPIWAAFTPISTTPATPPLQRYEFSPNISVLFCGTCGTSLFFDEMKKRGPDGLQRSYGVFTGCLANVAAPGPPILRVVDHIFAGDTLDGGAIPWMRKVGTGQEKPPRVWMGRQEVSEEIVIKDGEDWPSVQELASSSLTAGDLPEMIPFHCHCKGVNLRVRRSDIEFANTPAEELSWYTDPGSRKALANYDPCDSCRLASGVDVFQWTFARLRQIQFPSSDNSDGPAFPDDAGTLKDMVMAAMRERNDRSNDTSNQRLGTLAMYASSPDVQRYFCSRCSATVFYACDDRPEMVDIGVGLLDTSALNKTGGLGARAESLLTWNFGAPMPHRENVIGGWREGLVVGIEKEAEEWRLRRGLEKSYLRVMRGE